MNKKPYTQNETKKENVKNCKNNMNMKLNE